MRTGEFYLGHTILVRDNPDRPGTFTVEIDGRLLVQSKVIKSRTEGVMIARKLVAEGRLP